MQVLVSIGAFLAYCSLLKTYVFKSQPTKSLIAAFVTWAPAQVMVWSGYALTESLMISYLVIWIWLDMRQRDNPAILSKSFAMVCFFDAVLMLHRPAFFPWPLLVYGLRSANIIWARARTPDKIPLSAIDKKTFLRLAWISLIALGFCTYVHGKTGHFEITPLPRIHWLGVIIKYGKVDIQTCERQDCDPLTKEALNLLRTKGEAEVLQYSKTDTFSPVRILHRMQELHPELSESEILDPMLHDLSQPAQMGLIRHSMTQFLKNISNWTGSHHTFKEFNAQFPSIFAPWNGLSALWEKILSIGLIGLLLRPKTMTSNPFLLHCLSLCIYTSIIVAVFPATSYARLMAPTQVMMNLLGLCGLFVLWNEARTRLVQKRKRFL